MKTPIRYVIKLTKMILYVFSFRSTYCNHHNMCRNDLMHDEIMLFRGLMDLCTISKIYHEIYDNYVALNDQNNAR